MAGEDGQFRGRQVMLWRGQYILALECMSLKDCWMLCESRVDSCAIVACSHYMHAYLFSLIL